MDPLLHWTVLFCTHRYHFAGLRRLAWLVPNELGYSYQLPKYALSAWLYTLLEMWSPLQCQGLNHEQTTHPDREGTRVMIIYLQGTPSMHVIASDLKGGLWRQLEPPCSWAVLRGATSSSRSPTKSISCRCGSQIPDTKHGNPTVFSMCGVAALQDFTGSSSALPAILFPFGNYLNSSQQAVT